jgi:hypothetical protein
MRNNLPVVRVMQRRNSWLPQDFSANRHQPSPPAIARFP